MEYDCNIFECVFVVRKRMIFHFERLLCRFFDKGERQYNEDVGLNERMEQVKPESRHRRNGKAVSTQCTFEQIHDDHAPDHVAEQSTCQGDRGCNVTDYFEHEHQR